MINELEGETRVFLLGCPACANMSLNIQNSPDHLPVLTLTPTGFKAVSMNEEVDRLTALLNRKGFNVDSWVGKYPIVALCVPDDRNRKKILRKCRDPETVITLCCDAGKKSVESMLPEKRVIAGMNARGIVNGLLKSKMAYTRLYIEKESVNITPFTLDTQARVI
jgi:hypothetical protein